MSSNPAPANDPAAPAAWMAPRSGRTLVLLAATALEIWKARAEFAAAEVETLAISCVVSFISALLATKFLLRVVSRHSFAGFAWYRIVFGAVILITSYTGLVRW